MKVLIDARLSGGQSGGVEQFVLGLAYGFSQLKTGDQFDFMIYEGAGGWISQYISGPCRLVQVPVPPTITKWRARVRGNEWLRWLWHRTSNLITDSFESPCLYGFLSNAGYDVVHFTLQTGGMTTAIPSVYNPHDLQHLHLPQYFTPRIRKSREAIYRRMCGQARIVAASSEWIKRDLIRQYNLPEEKVVVVGLAAPVDAYGCSQAVVKIEDVRQRFNLPNQFALYPAQTWEHKNHINLLRAVAWLRDVEHLEVPLVCVGRKNDFFKIIQAEICRLKLERQVHFLGFVSTEDLHALYRASKCVVVPTKFEAGSFPLYEAFALGVPAAVSAVTSLPEQAGDAALVFSPEDDLQIAGAIRRLWCDEELCQRLSQRGRKSVENQTWARTAEGYVECYRRANGSAVSLAARRL